MIFVLGCLVGWVVREVQNLNADFYIEMCPHGEYPDDCPDCPIN